MPRRDLARRAPPSQAIAADATSPAGSYNGEVVWSTVENDWLRWGNGAWRQVPRLAIAADGAPSAVAAASSLGTSKVAAPLNHAHAHGNQSGGATGAGMHALADATYAGFQSAAHFTVTQNLAAGTVNGNLTVTGAFNGRDTYDDGTKLDGIELGATNTPHYGYASETAEGILAPADFADFHNMLLPPDGKVNRQWVPNAGVTTYDDRGWGAAVWGTPTSQAVQNVAALRYARIRYATAATSNAGAGVSGALNVQRSVSSNPLIGGFRFTARFRIVIIASTNQWFFLGLFNAGTWTGATLPTAIPNCLGFFVRNNVLSFITVPATASAFVTTPIAGITAASLGNGAEVFISSPESSFTTITFGIRPFDTQTWITGTVSTGLVAQGIALGPMCALSASTNLVATSAELGVMTLQSRY